MKFETTAFGEYVSCSNGETSYYLSYQEDGSAVLEVINNVHVQKTIIRMNAEEFEGMRMLFHLDLKKSEK